MSQDIKYYCVFKNSGKYEKNVEIETVTDLWKLQRNGVISKSVGSLKIRW
jgi:hypothetical protein